MPFWCQRAGDKWQKLANNGFFQPLTTQRNLLDFFGYSFDFGFLSMKYFFSRDIFESRWERQSRRGFIPFRLLCFHGENSVRRTGSIARSRRLWRDILNEMPRRHQSVSDGDEASLYATWRASAIIPLGAPEKRIGLLVCPFFFCSSVVRTADVSRPVRREKNIIDACRPAPEAKPMAGGMPPYEPCTARCIIPPNNFSVKKVNANLRNR